MPCCFVCFFYCCFLLCFGGKNLVGIATLKSVMRTMDAKPKYGPIGYRASNAQATQLVHPPLSGHPKDALSRSTFHMYISDGQTLTTQVQGCKAITCTRQTHKSSSRFSGRPKGMNVLVRRLPGPHSHSNVMAHIALQHGVFWSPNSVYGIHVLRATISYTPSTTQKCCADMHANHDVHTPRGLFC